MSDGEQTIPADLERRVIDNFVKRWAAILGLAVIVGTIILPAIAWAYTLRKDVDILEKRVVLLETFTEEAHESFRLICAMASDTLKLHAGATSCPVVYRHGP